MLRRSFWRPFVLWSAAVVAAACADNSLPTEGATALPDASALRPPSRAALVWTDGAQVTFTSGLGANTCLAVADGAAAPGTRVVLAACDGGAAQKFALHAGGTVKYGDLCLDVWGGQGRDGDAIGLWGCHGGANQRWHFTGNGEIRGLADKCLDVAGAQTVSGSAIIFYRCHNGSNQRWELADAGTTRSSASGLLVGLHQDLTYDGYPWRRAQLLADARAVNARVSRSALAWQLVEPRQGVRDWRRVDSVVAELTANGIEPLFYVLGSPSWANGVPASTYEAHFYVPQDPAAFEAWVARYRDFAAEAARRYRGRVRYWELWNEPNEHHTWKPRPNVDQYAAWYRAMYAAIKGEHPTADVALGGLTGLCCSGPTDYNGRAFLEALYARGVYPDVVTIHPYALQQQSPDATLPWENNFTDVAMMRDVMVRHGQGDKPMWATEWGWTSEVVGEATQAAYVGRALEKLATEYPYVTLATYFLDADRGVYRHGLFTSDHRMKPAGARFRDFAAAQR